MLDSAIGIRYSNPMAPFPFLEGRKISLGYSPAFHDLVDTDLA